MSDSSKQAGGWRTNKWVRAAIPALLLHCSIGTVYCWSVFSQEIADHIGFGKASVEWAFSFAIFFLGMFCNYNTIFRLTLLLLFSTLLRIYVLIYVLDYLDY